ncbi:extensin family protein [Stappia sp. F7233]|uniref:Extensin family protein n=1 Tax=Stappia albiluteola TaxID=2758565 RepID=A0A839AGE9_9HYPH|nr:extensin family protein [Stappia albiluteola]MBA5777837.1 extensin family protein [Stappia albiluteola]
MLALATLGGCGSFWEWEEREAWRASEERTCLTSGAVVESVGLRRARRIDGPGICGLDHPFAVSALQGGMVEFSQEATMGCPAIREAESWLSETVQPASLALYGQPVTGLTIAASYSCRGRNGASRGPLSEHAFANALDISAFRLADGRTIKVEDGWSDLHDGAFLRSVHEGACGRFSTVLGPEADRHHKDHLHLDLARHGRKADIRVCQ